MMGMPQKEIRKRRDEVGGERNHLSATKRSKKQKHARQA